MTNGRDPLTRGERVLIILFVIFLTPPVLASFIPWMHETWLMVRFLIVNGGPK